jgi:hypothetical protein
VYGVLGCVVRREPDVSEETVTSIIKVKGLVQLSPDSVFCLDRLSALKMEVMCSCETSDSLRTTRRLNLEDLTLLLYSEP